MQGKRLFILGASGQGKVAADIALKSGEYVEIGFFDDAPLDQCMGLPVYGRCGESFKYIGRSKYFVAIGNAPARKKYLTDLEKMGAEIATLVHPSAVIGHNVRIGAGSIVMAGAVLNAECRVGRGCIINTCASVDHDCVIGDYVHVSVGAHVAGTVTIGDEVWVGAGAVINNNLDIIGSCMIGSGAVVVKDINEYGTYVGVPARPLKY